MKNGTILLYKYEKIKGLLYIVSKSITFFTGMPYVHVAIYLDEKTYDYTVWKNKETNKWNSGVRINDGLLKAHEYYEPKINLTSEEVFAMQKYCEYLEQYKYNIFKLLSLAFVYPFRKIFKALNWVPFDNVIFGDVCSVLPDEAYFFVGHNLFPNEHTGYTVPGMYKKCDFFERKEI